MTFFTPTNLKSACGGTWLSEPQDADPMCGVGIDTRDDLTNKIFFAIRGDNHDGHDFLNEAISAGARLLAIDSDIDSAALGNQKIAVLLVDETRRALGNLAAAYRRTFVDTVVVAVTGSCGKTTTKTMIDAVLSTTMPGVAAPRSFNNDIGVPLTLFSVRPEHRYAVLEVGMNASGEIAYLAEIAKPDIAVVTNIGDAHLEAFGTRDAIAREKLSLLDHVGPGGVAILNADCPYAAHALNRVADTTTFGMVDREKYPLQLPGVHNAYNAAVAVKVGERLGVPDADIRRALATMPPPPQRMERHEISAVVFCDDAYNANPQSMRASIAAFLETTNPNRRRILVLGDMLELGDAAAELHQELGRWIVDQYKQHPICMVVGVGPLMRRLIDVLSIAEAGFESIHVSSLDERTCYELLTRLAADDQVLLKGSRGIALDRILDAARLNESSVASTT